MLASGLSFSQKKVFGILSFFRIYAFVLSIIILEIRLLCNLIINSINYEKNVIYLTKRMVSSSIEWGNLSRVPIILYIWYLVQQLPILYMIIKNKFSFLPLIFNLFQLKKTDRNKNKNTLKKLWVYQESRISNETQINYLDS